MINSEAIKLQLVQDIINLPDHLAPLVQDFLANLVSSNGGAVVNGTKRSKTRKVRKRRSPRSAKRQVDYDPILDLIGIASYDPPTKSIDEELYGEPSGR